MKKFVGVKVIEAKPMTVSQFEEQFDRAVPWDGAVDAGGYLVVYPDGYKSWCPEYAFEAANVLVDGVDDIPALLNKIEDALNTKIQFSKDAEELYLAYGAVTDFKNFQGNPMPEYKDLPEIIKLAWQAAAEV